MKFVVKHIHFVGIGGTGMCGIAEVLLNLGYTVSGSDLSQSPVTERLQHLGATIYQGHCKENINGADCLVVSSAVHEGNPEVQAARRANIPVVPRAVMLAELMRLRRGIAIAGTREYIVAEADESDASFLNLSPVIAAVTNIDQDHMDTYGHDFVRLKKAFIDFIGRLPFYGVAVLCTDDKNVASTVPMISRRVVAYGLNPEAEVRAIDVRSEGTRMRYTILRQGHEPLPVVLNLPGMHNVVNSLAAVAIATLVGVSDEAIVRALAEFTGVGRRFAQYGEVPIDPEHPEKGTFTLVDDYGHHPHEMAATIAAARGAWPGKRLVLAFQPHRYTRTRDCFEDFIKVLSQVDRLVLADVYPAGEDPIPGAGGRDLARVLRLNGCDGLVFCDSASEMPQAVRSIVEDGDVVLTMGAGNVARVPQVLSGKII